jgi:N-acetyltransferase 10
MKKKIDTRIQTLIENGHKSNQRTMLMLVGDRSRYQVLNFHYILSKLGGGRNKPKVLWCYKNELEFSSHQKKRMTEIKNLQMKGLYDENVDDAFELFVSSNEIRYTYYKESHKILGNTYQMLILQDFEALTPNLLCRTIETVEGGGLVIFLMRTMTSLKQLHTITMDVHQRYRTDAHSEVEPRFNERFLLSLSKNSNCIVMDD